MFTKWDRNINISHEKILPKVPGANGIFPIPPSVAKSGKDFLDLESHPLFIIVTIFFAIEGAVVHFPPKTHINFSF